MKVREVLEKSRFLGKQLNRPKWCFAWVIAVYLLCALTPSHSPKDFYESVLDVLFCTIPIVMLPVIVWGNLWLKVFALLLSALPIVVILVAIFGPRSARPF